MEKLEFYSSDPLKRFLQIDTFSPETAINSPKLEQALGPLAQGIRDFCFVEPSCLLVLNSEMSITTRVDSYLTNMKMPWEKTAPPVIMGVSALECYIETGGKYERLWSKSFKVQSICMSWDSEKETVYVGCDDGKVLGIQVKSEYK